MTLLFFSEAEEDQVKNVIAILRCFEVDSCLKINFFKSECSSWDFGGRPHRYSLSRVNAMQSGFVFDFIFGVAFVCRKKFEVLMELSCRENWNINYQHGKLDIHP